MLNRQTNLQDIMRASLSSALCHYIGKGKRYNRKSAALLIGCSEGTLENLINAATECSHVQVAYMARVFGPEFLNLYLEPLGLTGVRPSCTLEASERRLHTSISQFDAALTEATEDGNLNHQERAKLVPMARDVQQKAETFIHAAS